MGVYIRGMNMPKDREQYHRVTIYGNGQVIIDHGTYYEEAEAIPAADVRPVVLCRDCKHYSADSEMKCVHMFGLIEPDEDDFCSLGERREGGTS